MSTYAMIATSSILSHENNPRKVIGDITELANSIKMNGILQHLTVVPFEDKYKCIIGHRRLAAAKKAGLEEVPCIVEEMTEEEQIRTMMMENMQRENLTAREEALGFQMMFDLGEDVKTVAKKTGFSQTTVRHRTKLLDLDSEKLKASEERGAKLTDYIKLEEIKDIEVRNKVLDHIGTNNFNAELTKALEAQKKAERTAKIVKHLSSFAKQIERAYSVNDEHVDMTYVESIYLDKDVELKEYPEGMYYFTVSSYSVTLYKEGKSEYVPDPVVEAKRQKTEAIRSALEEKQDMCIQLRHDFVMNFSACKKFADRIRDWYFDATFNMIGGYSATYNFKNICCEMLGLDDKDEEFDAAMREAYKENPERVMLVSAYAIYAHKDCRNWTETWNAETKEYDFGPKVNDKLNKFYEFLCSLGYVMSDEEVAYCAYDNFSE